MELSTDLNKAEQYLQIHNDSIVHMQNCVFEVLQRGQDLCGVSSAKPMMLNPGYSRIYQGFNANVIS